MLLNALHLFQVGDEEIERHVNKSSDSQHFRVLGSVQLSGEIW